MSKRGSNKLDSIKHNYVNTQVKVSSHSKKHRERCIKGVDPHLPAWKHKILIWNEHHLGKIELFVERTIPFLVIILLLIIFAEFGDYIGHFFEKMFHYAEEHHSAIIIIDYVIISFFAVDLYFAFFKKSTLWRFLKAHFVDILAIIPVTFFLRIYVTASTIAESVSAGQKVTHVISDIPKVIEATRDVEKLVKVERALKIEESLSKTAKLEEGFVRGIKGARFFSRIPRIARLFRLRHLIHVKKIMIKEKIKKLRQEERKMKRKKIDRNK